MSRLVNRQGEIYNGIQIVDELGGGFVYGVCEYGHYHKYNKYQLTHGVVQGCPVCKELDKQYKLNIKNKNLIGLDNIKEGTVHGSLRVLRRLNKDKLLVGCELCKGKFTMHIEEFRQPGAKCKQCELTSRTNMEYHLGEVVNGLKIIERVDKNRFLCKCIRCGNTETKDYNALFSSRRAKCSLCSTDKYISNIDGMVFGGQLVLGEKTKITSLDERYEAAGSSRELDSGKMPKEESLVLRVLQVKCLDCGKEYNALKGGIMSKSIVCPECRGRRLICECPHCGVKMKVARKSRLKNVECMCGNVISLMKILEDLDTKDTVEHLRHKFNINSSKYIIHNNGIVVFNVLPSYVGRNLKRYYDAICLTHNKKVLLSQDEVDTYNHDQCSRGYNI